jgi:uncharacterized RDD family membrane protein YckC
MLSFEEHWVCGGCKSTFFQRIREVGTMPVALPYAGFWIRLGARLVDNFILRIVDLMVVYGLEQAFGVDESGALTGPATVLGVDTLLGILLLRFAVPIGYEIFFVGKFGATPGKIGTGLKVVRSDGGRVGYGRATARLFATWLSYATLGVGFLMAAFDEEKRTLHDRLCDTRVIKA